MYYSFHVCHESCMTLHPYNRHPLSSQDAGHATPPRTPAVEQVYPASPHAGERGDKISIDGYTSSCSLLTS
ncbi:hypothetical protein KC318_g16 [Hortaea werneckii]|nr:hypothetical protein KC334_g15 [Hortaea werneckii]KAI7028352.1 hypothetical protein KC355_g17 [Hortaea werneckii]KAI7676780.1 hypothetical protein KC318_g16 [Hortaea werneckii]